MHLQYVLLFLFPVAVTEGAQLTVRNAKTPVHPQTLGPIVKLLTASTGSFKILSIIPLPASSGRLSFDGTLVLLTTSTRLLLIDPTLLPERGPRKLWWHEDRQEEDEQIISSFSLTQAQASIRNGEKLQYTMSINELKKLGVVEVIEEFIEPVRAAAMLGGRIILGLGENVTHVWTRNPLRAEEVRR